MRTSKMQRFIDGYIECALWSSLDDVGDPLDQYTLSKGGRAALSEVAERFALENADLLAQAMCNRPIDYLGHDLWLTQNGHGTGFWDRGELDEPAFYADGNLRDLLSDAARALGALELYVDDCGEVQL